MERLITIRLPFQRVSRTSLLILACALAGCKKSDESPGAAAAGERSQKVTVSEAKEDKVTDFIELTGRTKADKLVDIRSRVSGFLRKTHFVDGQRVAEGDVLYTIEPDQYQAIYNQSVARVKVAETKLNLAERSYERIAKAKNAVSQEEVDIKLAERDSARAELVAAQADAARTKLDVEYTTIKSPIAGRVDRSLIDDGNYVTGGALGGTVLTTVVSDRPMDAVANVDENVVLHVMRRMREVGGEKFKEANQIAELKVPCFMQLSDEKGYPHEGIVEYLQVRVDQATGSSSMRATFKNEKGLLKAGMFVRLRVPVSDEYKAVLVPDRAIGTDQTTRFVFVVDKSNVVQFRPVELGDRKGDLRVLKSGVKPGEIVVTAGLQLIQPGMKVEPEMQKAPVPGADAAKPTAPRQPGTK